MEQGKLLSETVQVHTWWKNNMLLKYIVKLRYSARTTSSIVQSTRRKSTSTFQDYHVLQWNNHMASTFKNKIENHPHRHALQSDLNNIDNSILSAKNHKTWLKQLETSNCVNYSMLSQKHNAKHAWRFGTLASSTARAGTSCEMERKRTRDSSSTLLTSFRFKKLLHQERATPRAPLREEARGSRVLHHRIRSRRIARREISWVFTTGSSVMTGSARTWLNWVAVKKYVVKWTNWRTKTTRTTSLQIKFECVETIGGSVRILLVPTRCP